MARLAWLRPAPAGQITKAWVVPMILTALSPAPCHADEPSDFSSLPPIGAGITANAPSFAHPPLPVSVVINGKGVDELCLAASIAGGLFVPVEALRQWGLRLPEGIETTAIDGRSYASLDGVAGLSVRMDNGGTTLLIDADPRLFPAAHLSRDGQRLPVASAVPAQFIGYDLSLSRWNGKLSASAFLDAGMSGNWGVLDTTGLVQSEGHGFVRLDSSFQRDFPDRRLRLIVGDTLTRGGDWSRPVRFGGIRLGTDFSLTPDEITYPLPVLRGSAALPSTVELAAASSRQTLDVQRGDFSIDYQPVFTGSGEVTMTIRDASGATRNITRSFYTSPRLLREGLDDFSLEAGFLREDFGWSSFSYGAPFAAASWRHGLTAALTLFGRAEGSGDSQAAGWGAGLIVAPLGEFSLTAAASQGKWGSGTLWRAQFQRITQVYAITASYKEESADFMQVGDPRPEGGKRGELAVAGSLALGRLGNLSASHVENGQADRQRFSTSSLSYSANLGAAYLSLGARRTRFSQSRDDGLFGSITLPFGQRANASLFIDRNRIAATASQSPPSDRGIGYRLLAARDLESRMMLVDGGLTFRTAAGDVDLSAASHGGSGGVRLAARGALLIIDGEVIAAPRLDYAFALVDVTSDEEVGITFENRSVAQRAGNGKKAIVTGLQPYAANRIAVDLDSLPIDVLVTSPEQRVVPGFRQAVRVSFGGVASRPTTLWLSDSGGEPLPTGATAMIGNEPPAIVGQGGEVYVADAHPGDPIMVRGADMQCRAIVPPLPLDVHAPRIGPVTCTPVKEDERK